MIGMRNRLIHDYMDIDLKTVWETIQNDLPPLIITIEPLIPPEEPGWVWFQHWGMRIIWGRPDFRLSEIHGCIESARVLV